MKFRQSGAALAVSLILVVVASMLGISAMNSSQLGERIAGNERQVSEAFMAAETGLAVAKSRLDANPSLWDKNNDVVDLDSLNAAPREVRAGLVWEVVSATDEGDDLRVVTEGRVEATGTFRRIEAVYKKAVSGLAPINIIGRVGRFDAAKSDAFQVEGRKDADGNYVGPAIATTGKDTNKQYVMDGDVCVPVAEAQSNQDIILGGIDEKRLGNYKGGIEEVEFENPFGSAEGLMNFINEIRQSVEDNPDIKGTAPDDMGTSDEPKITIVEGDLLLGGNDSGAGVLLVVGNLTFSGTPSFEGLIIVTGQQFKVSGGGKGGVIGGSIVFANPVQVPGCGWQFGEAQADFQVDVDGGGTSVYRHDEGALVKARELLNADAQELWDPEATNGANATLGSLSNWKLVD